MLSQTEFKAAPFCDSNLKWIEHVEREDRYLEKNRKFISTVRARRAHSLDTTDGIQTTRMMLSADRAILTGKAQRR